MIQRLKCYHTFIFPLTMVIQRLKCYHTFIFPPTMVIQSLKCYHTFIFPLTMVIQRLKCYHTFIFPLTMVIQRLKCYHTFIFPLTMVGSINQIITLCVLLRNFEDLTIKQNVDVALMKWKSNIVVRLQTAFLKPQMITTYFCAQVKETIILIKVYPK